MSQLRNRLAYASIYFTQLLIAPGIRLFVLPSIKKTVHLEGLSLSKDKTYVIAANHQHGIDPFVLIATIPWKTRKHFLPIKFMTKLKFYYRWWKPGAYLSGCFPARARYEGDTASFGVGEAVRVAKLGYSVLIFPEGRVTKVQGEERAHSGVSRILTELPEAELILCKIIWSKNKKGRFTVDLHYENAGPGIDRSNPQQILDSIYGL